MEKSETIAKVLHFGSHNDSIVWTHFIMFHFYLDFMVCVRS